MVTVAKKFCRCNSPVHGLPAVATSSRNILYSEFLKSVQTGSSYLGNLIRPQDFVAATQSGKGSISLCVILIRENGVFFTRAKLRCQPKPKGLSLLNSLHKISWIQLLQIGSNNQINRY